MTTTATGVDQAVVDMMGGVFAEHRSLAPRRSSPNGTSNCGTHSTISGWCA